MPDNGAERESLREGGTDMRGRRRKDDGWDESAADGQDGRRDTWSDGGLPEDWTKRNRTDSLERLEMTGPAVGADRPAADWPGAPGAHSPGTQWPDGQAAYGSGGPGAAEYGGQWRGDQASGGSVAGGQGFGSAARGVQPDSGPGQGYGAFGNSDPGYQAARPGAAPQTSNGYGASGAYGASGGYGNSAAYGASSGGYDGSGYGTPGGYGASGAYGTSGGYGAPGASGPYSGPDAHAPSGGYGSSGAPGAPDGYGGSGGYPASAGYGASGHGDRGGQAYGYAGSEFADAGFGGQDQSGSAYQDAGYGHSAYGFGETSATPHYGRSQSAVAPDLGNGQYATADWAEALNEGSPGTPRPYGRLSIFTLLEDKTAEFDRLAERASEGVRTVEPDTLVYVIHVVPKAPMQRIIYEIYRDRAAFESHERQPHIQRFMAERKACVLATNIIDLRLKYAKVAAITAAQTPRPSQDAQQAPVSRAPQPTQNSQASQALEPAIRTPSFIPHSAGQPSGSGTAEHAELGNARTADGGGRRQAGATHDRFSQRSQALDRDQASYQGGRYGES